MKSLRLRVSGALVVRRDLQADGRLAVAADCGLRVSVDQPENRSLMQAMETASGSVASFRVCQIGWNTADRSMSRMGLVSGMVSRLPDAESHRTGQEHRLLPCALRAYLLTDRASPTAICTASPWAASPSSAHHWRKGPRREASGLRRPLANPLAERHRRPVDSRRDGLRLPLRWHRAPAALRGHVARAAAVRDTSRAAVLDRSRRLRHARSARSS